ncbi:MAG: D-alanine--D-alanine ligase [Pseudomonadota bacterium]|nr:D-alanine--D-alanine ligase [Pseudomonadota bacterium]
MALRKKNRRVALVKGGDSSEKNVSLATGAQCSSSLKDLGYDVFDINAGANLIADLELIKPDVIFNALHGGSGEDGTIQGCFEWLKIPYTHSGVLASALAMNKSKSREIFKCCGLPVPPGRLIDSEQAYISHPLKVPYVIKPNNEGSSLGVHIIRSEAEKIRKAFNLPKYVLVEEFIPGRELTVSVMHKKPLAVTEVISPVWYDYDAKYTVGGSSHIVPAHIPPEVRDACLNYSIMAHNALGCRGLTRTDFRWNDTLGIEGLFVLELNTQPGMTPTSLVPEQAKFCGISFSELCEWILEDASCSR